MSSRGTERKKLPTGVIIRSRLQGFKISGQMISVRNPCTYENSPITCVETNHFVGSQLSKRQNLRQKQNQSVITLVGMRYGKREHEEDERTKN